MGKARRNLLKYWKCPARFDLALNGGRRDGLSEGTKEEYEPPALVGGQTTLEGGHGAAALGDLVEDVAVGERVHMRGVGEIDRGGLLHPGLWAVAFTPIAVALGALFAVDLAGGAQIGVRSLERVLKFLEFIGDDPWSVLLGHPADDQNEDEDEKSGKGKFAEPEILWRIGGHRGRKNLRTSTAPAKGIDKRRRGLLVMRIIGSRDPSAPTGVETSG
jgi:hypothetical protein